MNCSFTCPPAAVCAMDDSGGAGPPPEFFASVPPAAARSLMPPALSACTDPSFLNMKFNVLSTNLPGRQIRRSQSARNSCLRIAHRS